MVSREPHPDLRIVAANHASWEDLAAIFGRTDYPARCFCQRYRTGGPDWNPLPVDARAAELREQAQCGFPDAEGTSGIVGYVDDEPAAWVAVAPRTETPALGTTPWRRRSEARDDASVWAVTCVVVRRDFRGQGLTAPMIAATVEHARAAGAAALEGYPMVTEPGKTITWGELHVGPLKAFLNAGFAEVSAPSKRRRVVRLEL